MSDMQTEVQAVLDRLVGSGAERGLQVAVYRHGEQVVEAVAGVPGLPVGTQPEAFLDWDGMCALIAGAEPWWDHRATTRVAVLCSMSAHVRPRLPEMGVVLLALHCAGRMQGEPVA
jgi:hypothetical protein